MINLNDCVEIGQFTRSHGYKGQLILKLNNLSFDEIEDMEWVYVLIDGLPVPFSIYEFSERTSDSLFVNLSEVKSIEKTKELLSTIVYIDKKVLKENPNSKSGLPRLIGYKVSDISSGYIGLLDSIIENPQNPLLRILNNKQEILVPFQESFIVEVNNESKTISLDCPTGLLDL